ncbi:Similar to Sil1: Nucleotide exchange factor Sil1 (Drosophila melanogaster) [Cotesia congregata]|uniref:Nucleotide exchange factor SIL1 n=1 Tax=Cotesia congregata TaxID=51543 RepID=A0A8J2HQG7_COTCN|nr:Similar to Sil1: Nucleotide exchange factor Sil1 (Drosophila melanogaster) [Cotesia congregata]
MTQYLKFFIINLLFIYSIDYLSVSGMKNESKFIATNEWQTVKKGQPIPSGLHIRYNFETKVTEAKLMDKDDNDNKSPSSLTIHPEALVNDEDDILVHNNEQHSKLKLSLEELKTRLKKIKTDANNNMNQAEDNTEKKYRSYEELKDELKSIDMNITTDSEIMIDLFQRFKIYDHSLTSGSLQSTEIEDILQIFNDLEYLLHQIDIAQLFADMEGMSKIISPCLNTTNDDLKIEALRVLGTAVQLNPKVQQKALNNDLVQKLLHLLSVNNKPLVRSRCLFALGALIRQFPSAQKAFIDHGGLEIFGKILKNDFLQTQFRAIKLITDLAIERELINKTEDEGLRLRKVQEYKKTNFEQKLILHNYCKYLSSIVQNNFIQDDISLDSSMEMNEFLQVVLENMIVLCPVCKDEFRNHEHRLSTTFSEIINYYNKIKNSKIWQENEMLENNLEQLSNLQKLIFEDFHDEL